MTDPKGSCMRANTVVPILLAAAACAGDRSDPPLPFSPPSQAPSPLPSSLPSPTPDPSPPTPPDTAPANLTSTPPCDAVAAIFFDLGETLVVPSGPQFVARSGAAELLDALEASGVRLGVITNVPDGYTMDDLRALLVDPSLLDRFEVVLPSSLASSGPKPDPAIFAEAHALLPRAPPIEQTAFVTEEIEDIADDAKAPTQGARAAGMVGVLLTDASDHPLADHTSPPDALPAMAEAEWLSCEGR